MKRFQSRLQRVQRVLNQQRRAAEMALIKEQQRLQTSKNQEQQFRDMIAQLQQQQVQLLMEADVVLVQHMQAASLNEQAQLGRNLGEQRSIAEQLERARRSFQELDARCQGVEKLLDQQRSEYRRECVDHEQAEIDDINMIRGSRTPTETVPTRSKSV